MKRILCGALALLCIGLAGCRQQNSFSKSDFFAMNTYVQVMADGADAQLLSDIRENILLLEKTYSATFEDSDVSRLTSGVRPQKEVYKLLERVWDISNNTNGAFDFTMGALTQLWAVNSDHPHVPSQEELEEVLSHCGYQQVRLSEDVYYCDDDLLKLDLGAAVKGYAGQRQIDCLRAEGVQNAAVNIGGNVSVIGSSEANKKKGISGWNVAVNNPFEPSDILGTLLLRDSTVSVSGSYERYFEKDGRRYHHIFDSITGYPADSGLVSVAVIASDGLLADALSTALFVLGFEDGMELYRSGIYDFEAVFCTEEGTVYYTDGLSDSFTPNREALNSKGNPLSFQESY